VDVGSRAVEAEGTHPGDGRGGRRARCRRAPRRAEQSEWGALRPFARPPGRAPARRRTWRAALCDGGGARSGSVLEGDVTDRASASRPLRQGTPKPGQGAGLGRSSCAHRTLSSSHGPLRFRAAPTTTEALLWEALRAEKLGVRFRRQVVLGRYIADFVAPRAKARGRGRRRGASRGASGADARRDRDLGRMGYRVLRLPRELVQERLEEAVALVVAALGERGR
jgi:very-short-patch-repair endonuclease